MNQSKLLQIINKDLTELKELTDELIQSEDLSKIEIEIALSKSKLISQEFELLKEKALIGSISPAKQKPESKVIIEKDQTSVDSEPIKTEPVKTTDNGNIKEAEVVLKNDDTPVTETKTELTIEEEIQDKIIEKEKEDISEEEIIAAPPIKNEVEEIQEEVESHLETSIEQNEFKVDIEEEEEPTIIVGETFSKGKSLNDSMTENQTLDQKFASSPITNLEPSIGLNDRFLFIRELFDGNTDNFNNAVTEIDKLGGLKEAVNYLSSNYKWKKTEASLKFVELVKRRFQS